MTSQISAELDAFRRFVDEQVAGGTVSSVDELWAKYQRYREELGQLRAELVESIAQAENGQAQPLDLDALHERVRRRLLLE